MSAPRPAVASAVPRDGDTRRLFAETASRVFADGCDRATRSAAADGRWPEHFWSTITGAGLTDAALLGEGDDPWRALADSLDVLKSAGRYAVPVPLGETIVAGWLLARAGLPVPQGPLAFATGGPLRFQDERGRCTRLVGTARRVPWGRHLAALVVALESDPGRCRLALVEAGGWTVGPGANLAGEPRDDLSISAALDTAQPADLPVPADAVAALGAALRVMQMAGALARIVELSVSYAQARVQFGRPLGTFQAVQQSLAVLAAQAAAAAAAAEMTVAAVAAGRPFPAIAIAKARVGEAASLGASLAHQVHGAIGFTGEFELGHLTKRLWAWRDEFGGEPEWNRAVGRALLRAGPDRLWFEITAV